MTQPWTGPHAADWADATRTRLVQPVPAARWPYGPPDHHQDCCALHGGGLFCDCEASAADDLEWGEGA